MSNFWQDLRLALRGMWKQPGFTRDCSDYAGTRYRIEHRHIQCDKCADP